MARIAVTPQTFWPLVAAVLIVLTLWGSYSWSKLAAAGREVELYPASEPLDATLLALDRAALKDAYHDQVLRLFRVYVSQQARDRKPIMAGLQIARRAYSQAAAQIAKREQMLLQKGGG
jgi:hypothetical protein